MSTTRSPATGAPARGSTTTWSPSPSTGVTQARTSRPLTRMPQVPQEACRQECRTVRLASCRRRTASSASSTVVRGPTGTRNSS